MMPEPVVLDTDTLSALSRGNLIVRRRSLAYLADFGRLTISAITVFERLRGYRAAIRAGKPFDRQLQAFEALVANCVVLPFDQNAAAVAADIWAAVTRSRRRQIGDILIAAVAVSRQIPLATRNTRDFQHMAHASGVKLRLVDWTVAQRGGRAEGEHVMSRKIIAVVGATGAQAAGWRGPS